MRAFWLLALGLPAVVALQTTLLAHGLAGGATLNAALLLVLLGGFEWGAAAGASLGLWGGALMGAAVGSLAIPLCFCYGVIGWLAGLQSERRPLLWTLPLTGVALIVFTTVAEAHLGVLYDHSQPSLAWKMASIVGNGLVLTAVLCVQNLWRKGRRTIET